MRKPSAGTFLLAAALALSAPVSASVEGDTIILGSAISLTGKYSQEGKNAKDGYDLAVKRINEQGGVKVGGEAYKLQVQYYDDESTPARTAQLLERLIRQDGVKFVLGPYSSGTTKAAAPITEKHRIPMVEAEGASRSLFTQGYKYLFAVLSTSEQYLKSAIDLAAEVAKRNGKKPGDVRPRHGVREQSVLARRARRRGRGRQEVRHGHRHRRQAAARSVGHVGHAHQGEGAQARPAGGVGAYQGRHHGRAPVARDERRGAARRHDPLRIRRSHQQAFGEAVEGILCPTQWAETLSYRGKVFGSAADYDKLFRKTYAEYETVPYQAAQASAAVIVWKDAFERAQSFDTERLRDAIAATELETFYGNIKFGPRGNNIAKPMVLRQIQDGEYNVVAPAKWASHKLEYHASR